MPYTHQKPTSVFEGTLDVSIQQPLDDFYSQFDCIEADARLTPTMKRFLQELTFFEYLETLDRIKEIKSASMTSRRGKHQRARTMPTPVHLNGIPGVPFDATPSPSNPVFLFTNSGNPSATTTSFFGPQPGGANVVPMSQDSFNARPIPLTNDPMNSFGEGSSVNATALGQIMQRLKISADSPGPSAPRPRKESDKKAGKRQQQQQDGKFLCKERGCPTACVRERDLKRHMKDKHDPEKSTYHCVVCDKKFTRDDSLQRHIRNSCTKKGFKRTKTY